MKINQIRDVVAAAQFGSIRAAARSLNIAQPALTRSIRAIERELGVPLFERTQHGVQVTRLGSAFLTRAQSVQIELRRATEEVRQMQGQMQGTISVAMSPLVGRELMPDALRAFRRNYPLAAIEICEGLFETVELGMIRSQHDCYIGSYSTSEKRMSYQVEKLLESDRVILARWGHPRSGATSLTELLDAEWVKTKVDQVPSEADFEHVFAENGLPMPKIAMSTNSAMVAISAVAASDMLTVLPSRMIGKPLMGSLFEIIRPVERLAGPSICLVHRADLPLTPLAEAFCDQIRRAAAQAQAPATAKANTRRTAQ